MTKINIEIHDEKITDRGINAIIDFYHTLAIDEQSFPQAMAFATRINSPFLNVLFDLRTDRTNSTDLANGATAFFNKHQVPWGWFIIPACSKHNLVQQGFTLLEEAPAMYFNLSNPLPNLRSNFITIQELPENDDLSLWIQPINEGFQTKGGG